MKLELQGLDQLQNKMSITFEYKCFIKQTINNFLLKKGYSDNNIYYLIKNKNVLINDNVALNKNHIIKFDDKIKVTLNDETSDLYSLKDDLDIVYEDKYFIIVNKPFNMDVEPSKANYEDNLASRVNYYFKSNNIKSKIHLVNRLDKLTSGLVIIAKNQYIHNLFSKVKITKKYKALVQGKVRSKATIKVKIKKDENSIKRIVSEDGKISITKYRLISYSNDESLVDIKLITGRTHQIRVSFAHINHPLISDPLYGKKEDRDMMLNAYHLSFIHPITHKKISINK